MRLPRVRFTIRRMMVAVAIVAASISVFVECKRLARKSAACRARAAEHAGTEQTLQWIIAASGGDAPVDISPGPGLRSIRFTAQAVAEWEGKMKRKYERAARYPWLPVQPDAPEPE